MIAVLVAIAVMLAAGLPAALAIEPRARGLYLTGLAFLYGSALVFVTMLVLALAHIGWSVAIVLIALAVIAGALALIAVRRLRRSAAETNPVIRGGLLDASIFTASAIGLDLCTLLVLVSYCFYTTLAPLWEWDFWAIWGLKARVFAAAGGIDWRFLESEWNRFVHPDYPLLLPLNLDFIALLNGGWSDRWLGLLNVAFAAAGLGIVRSLVRREQPPVVASLATLAVATTAATRFVGLGEGPLIAFGAVAVLMLRRALATGDAAARLHGVLLLGFAASCKNEGLALLIAVAIALFIAGEGSLLSKDRFRSIANLWPALVAIAPWMLMRATHSLGTDIASGPVLVRMAAHLRHAGEIAIMLGHQSVDRAAWIACLAGLFIAGGRELRRERFVLVAMAVQLVFFLLSYLATPNDVGWHIATSWSRLMSQLAIPITVVVSLMLARNIRGETAQNMSGRTL
ncbi:MAG TPA: hypothetical protein VEZ11_13125 [Thermoanaerobaculia bacterium]|nr:hypothetical protein [Thermoanaerobaculia bacterium]